MLCISVGSLGAWRGNRGNSLWFRETAGVLCRPPSLKVVGSILVRAPSSLPRLLVKDSSRRKPERDTELTVSKSGRGMSVESR